MKKFSFKILLLALVAIMVLAGCGIKNTNNEPATKDQSTTNASTKPSESQESDPYFGKYENPVEVKLAVPTNAAVDFPPGDSYSNNVWTRSWKEDLNIVANVMWEATDADGKYDTKLNLAIASNELPDIIQLNTYSQFEKLLNAGKLEDLTDYYEKYAYPLLKKNVTADGGMALSWGKVNGRLMGFPREGVNYSTTRMIYIRHDWFEKSGLPVPKTIEDVLAIAKAFKDADPQNRIGLAFFKTVLGDGFCDMTGIANAVGAYPGMWIEDGSGKLVYGTIQPQMKKAIQIYADLYKQGYIDKAFASIDANKVAEQITSDKIGVIIGNFWLPSWPLNTLWEKEGVDWDVYPLLPSKDLKTPLKVQTFPPQGRLVVVRKGYEHPEVLFKLLNYTVAKISDPEKAEPRKFHSDEKYGYHMFNPLYIVWEDPMTNYNSQVNVTNAIDKNDTSYLKTPHDHTQYDRVKKYFDTVKAGKKPDAEAWVAYKGFYGPNSTMGIQNKYFKDDSYLITKLVGYQTPTMVRQWANLQKLEQQYITQIIAGIKPLDAFDEFVQKWEDMGGGDIEKEVNDWYQQRK